MCFVKSCKKGGQYEIIDKTYCSRHFVEAVEKRVRKDLRVHKKITTRKTYTFLDSRTKEAAIAKRFLKSIFQGHLAIHSTKKAGNNTIIPTSMSRDIASKLSFYLDKKRVTQRGIPFLDNVTDGELCMLAAIWKIPAKRERPHPLVEAIERAHPGTMFALKKSLDEVAAHG